MTQRISLAAVVVLTIAGITASTIAWKSMQEGREVNQALLAKLEQMSTAPTQVSAPSNLSTLTLRLFAGSLQGDPIVDRNVRISGKPFPDDSQGSISAQTDEFGKVVFGPMNPGTYTSYFTASFGFFRKVSVTLYGGQEIEKEIAIPIESQLPGTEVEVSFKILRPTDLEIDRLIFALGFKAQSVVVNGETWSRGKEYWVCLNADDKVIPAKPNFGNSKLPPNKMPRMPDEFSTENSVDVFAGPYKCEELLVYYPTITVRVQLEDQGIRKSTSKTVYTRSATKHFGRLAWDSNESRPLFEADVDEPNLWEIEIPEPLVEQLRGIIAKADEKNN